MSGKMAFCTQMELLILWNSWEDSLSVVAAEVAARGEMFFVSRVGGKIIHFPPGGQCATVESSLQSIHIAEVHLDFIKKKKKLETTEEKKGVCHCCAPVTQGELRSHRGAVCLSLWMWKQVSGGTEGCGGGEAEGSGAMCHKGGREL